MFKINNHRVAKINAKPLTENVTVGNKPMSFEIDTGAGCYSILWIFYLENFKSSKLLPNDITLSFYMDEPIIPSGKLNVNVRYCSDEQNLDVIKNGAHPLMGTDWLQMFIVEIFFKSNTLFDIII